MKGMSEGNGLVLVIDGWVLIEVVRERWSWSFPKGSAEIGAHGLKDCLRLVLIRCVQIVLQLQHTFKQHS